MGNAFTSHLAEKAAHAELVGRTITVGTGKDFTTIQEAINSIKKKVYATITINVDAGTYNEEVVINGFTGSGSINLFGDTVVSTNCSVTSISVRKCSVDVYVRGFNGTGNGTTFLSYANIKCRFSLCNTIGAGTEGFAADSSLLLLSNNVASNKTTAAIIASNMTTIYSENNSGSGNSVGLYCYQASKIGKNGTQPSWTTAEYTSTGGQIL